MDLLNKTGVGNKNPGDSLTSKDINSINTTINNCVDAVNYILKQYCNVNLEVNDPERYFTLSEAAMLVPKSRRFVGMKLIFLESTSKSMQEFLYIGKDTSDGNWNSSDNWKQTIINLIDGGVW